MRISNYDKLMIEMDPDDNWEDIQEKHPELIKKLEDKEMYHALMVLQIPAWMWDDAFEHVKDLWGDLEGEDRTESTVASLIEGQYGISLEKAQLMAKGFYAQL